MNLRGIRKARKAAKMSQAELAKAIGIDRATVSRYESGAIIPSLGRLAEIAGALETTVYEMIGEDWGGIDMSDALDTVAEEDREVVEIALTLPPKEPLPNDLEALRSVMNLNGYDLIKSHGEYSLIGQHGGYRLSEEQVEELLNGSVQYVEFLCAKLERELSRFPVPIIPPPTNIQDSNSN